jgi:hypothetical protein
MVTSAVWTDFDNDKQTDLIIAGEWMPLRFFKNNHGHLVEATTSTVNQHEWVAEPYRNGYRPDGILTWCRQLGLNCVYQVSPAEPMQLDAAGSGWEWIY